MNCKGVITRISSYIDGDLEATIVEEIELHMKQCKHCFYLVQQTKLIIKLCCDSDLTDYPVEVQARLHETLRRKIRRERK